MSLLGLGLFVGTGVGTLARRYCKDASHLNNEIDENKVVTVSAPGKILIAGGYLVLESPNVGVTIATTSRFFTSIKWEKVDDFDSEESVRIVVSSPQFHSQYTYSYVWQTEKLINLGASSNEFVEKCIVLSFAFVQKHLGNQAFFALLKSYFGGQIHMKLRADNDFYSQIKELRARQLPLLSSSLFKLEKFFACPKDANGKVDVAKTGLGSSAALTTSLVAAILQWFEVVRLGMRIADDDRRLVHNLAQLVHANAQGKIGSGFDVAAAVYGTQTYSRFSSTAFNACLEESVSPSVLHQAVTCTDPTQGWSQSINPFRLPSGLVVVLGDVCGGSSSTSMAREVLKWRKNKPEEAAPVWNTLAETNQLIAACFESLNKLHSVDAFAYNEVIHWASGKSSSNWSTKNENRVIQCLLELKRLFTISRSNLKRMGELAGVEIEPESQTRLADATEALDGVVTALVPGAGGVDALVALVLSDTARLRVEMMWSEWHKTSGEGLFVCPLTLKAESGLLSGVNVSTLEW